MSIPAPNVPDTGPALEQITRAAENCYRVERARRWALAALGGIGAACLAVTLAIMLLGTGYALGAIMAFALVAGPLLTWIVGLVSPVDRRDLLLRMDRLASLSDATLALDELEGARDRRQPNSDDPDRFWIERTRRLTEARLRATDWQMAWPSGFQRWHLHGSIAYSGAVLMALLMIANWAVLPRDLPEIVRLADPLAEANEVLDAWAEEEQPDSADPGWDEVRRAIEAFREESRNREATKQDLLVKLNDVEDRLKKLANRNRSSALESSAEDLAKALEAMPQLRKAAREMREQNWADLARELQATARQMQSGEQSAEDKANAEALAKAMRELSEKMQAANREQAAELAQQLAEAAQQNPSQLAQQLQQMGREAQKQQARENARQQMRQKIDQLRDMKEGLNQPSPMGQQAQQGQPDQGPGGQPGQQSGNDGQQSGQSPSDGSPGNSQAPGDGQQSQGQGNGNSDQQGQGQGQGQSNGRQPGSAPGGSPGSRQAQMGGGQGGLQAGTGSEDPFGQASRLQADMEETNLVGEKGSGQSERRTERTSEGTGTSQLQGQERSFDQYERMSEEVIDMESIPPAHRDSIRKYFQLIRPSSGE